MATTRTEYRVVGREAPFNRRFELGPYPFAREAEAAAENARSEGDTNVRIQQRTITETPWTDLEGEEAGK